MARTKRKINPLVQVAEPAAPAAKIYKMCIRDSLSNVDPLTIPREGRAVGVDIAGYKKYLYQVWKIYNGSGKKYSLDVYKRQVLFLAQFGRKR